MLSIINELRRRNVFRVAGAYAVVGWLMAQISVTLETSLNLPSWFDTVIVSTLLLGFPIALLLAWAFEITPDGVKRSTSPNGTDDRPAFKFLDLAMISGLVLVTIAVGYQLTTHSTGQNGNAVTVDIDPSDTDPASIAVLPFVDLSDTSDQEYFSDGLSEELLNVLAQVDGLKVASRTSSFSFKDRNEDITQIADALSVAHVLEGSVRKSGTRLRITAQLVRAEDGFHIWSETYDRDLDDVFAIQDDISNRILDELRGRIMGDVDQVGVARVDPVAYDLVLRAREVNSTYSVSNLEAASALYRQAIEIDPDYAVAYAGLAGVELLNSDAGGVHGSRPMTEVLPIAEPLLEKALSLAPESPQVWMRIGLMRQFSGDFPGAEEAYLEAAELQPNVGLNNYAVLLDRSGRLNEAIAVLKQEREFNPRSAPEHNNLVRYLLQAGRLDEARRTMDFVKTEFPDVQGRFSAALYDALVLAEEGRWADSVRTAEHAYRETPNAEATVNQLGFSYMIVREYEKVMSLGSPIFSIFVLGLTGNADQALDQLQPFLASGSARGQLRAGAIDLAATDRDWQLIADTLAPEWPASDGVEPCSDQDYPHFSVVAAYKELGRTEQFELVIACWNEVLEFRRANGYNDSNEWVDRGAYLALRGQTDEAFDAFDRAAEPAITNIFFEDWIDILSLSEHPRGHKLLDDYYTHLNAERAKLDLPAIDR
ncbi:MAG: tetratricopeptide repeat protein [Pseudomonadota bacterium]